MGLSKRAEISLAATVILVNLSLAGVLGSGVLAPVNSEPPQDNFDYPWFLVIDGLVDAPLNISYDELLDLPSTSVIAKLRCVDDVFDTWSEVSNWTGVRLRDLLNITGIQEEAIKVAFYAIDGFSTDLTVETANRPDILVAYEQDGVRIPEGTGRGQGGAPLRLVVPGKWGYKWITWLSHIELVDYDFLGYYESRGYSDEADLPQEDLYPETSTIPLMRKYGY
ncbi:MAG: molybdopterin-dependent oxidoreductase [Candidatus Ranarchaeia archaeon]|jgi:DMSO/TMAO reductase YedYZ molybdopterin-dependent catalytic subunit